MANERPAGVSGYLRRLRLRAGLSQESLAERAGLTADAIGKLERGERRRLYPQTARALADALGLSDAEHEELIALAHGRAGADAPGRAPTIPPARAPARRTILPASLTSFVGREREMAQPWLLIAQGIRLLTLIGPGGVGKTRLAIEGARALTHNFPDGVWFVDLAPLTAPALVPQAVATALAVRDAPGRSFTQAIATALGDRRVLLILDNCEHVAEACATLVSAVLQGCAGVTVVATSRQPLHVAGEQVYPVPPLALPPARGAIASDPAAAPAALTEFASVRLFADRARLVRPDFMVTETNADAVADICCRLDGLPLAIELVAARVRVLSPEQLAVRLDDRFRIVATGSHGATPRHQTLRALLDWSYGLLTETEQSLLRRLSVFQGGCTVDAVEGVCVGDGIEAADALDLLTSLVEKSLVVADFQRGQARYRLLESVREYAADKLRAGGEAARLRDRHADWYLAFAERFDAEPDLSARQPRNDAVTRVIDEFDNLRGAFEWSLADGRNPSRALRLGNGLWWFWPYHSLLSEGRTWYERVLTTEPEVDPEARAYAVLHVSVLSFLGEDYQSGATYARRALDRARTLGLPVVTIRALRALGLNALSVGDLTAAQDYLDEAVALARAHGNRRWTAYVLDTLGYVLVSRGDGMEARRHLRDALDLARAEQMVSVIASSHMYLAFCDMLDGDVRGALANYLDALEVAAQFGHHTGMALMVAALALAVDADGRPLDAARLLGVWQAQSMRLGINAPPRNRVQLEQGLEEVRAKLGAEACDAALAEGRSMSMEEAVAYARTAACAGSATPS